MSDITTVWLGTYGDWAVDGADLEQGLDLETALTISLMSDRVLPDGVNPPSLGDNDPRGWWADDPAYPVGSRIWTLLRAKQSDQTLADAITYMTEATQWMIDDGVVASFDFVAEWDATGFLATSITANKPTGPSTTFNFEWAWNGLDNL